MSFSIQLSIWFMDAKIEKSIVNDSSTTSICDPQYEPETGVIYLICLHIPNL